MSCEYYFIFTGFPDPYTQLMRILGQVFLLLMPIGVANWLLSVSIDTGIGRQEINQN
jgi:hypothetical protein